jgi:tetratricopeptide (TPR) repeat protein
MTISLAQQLFRSYRFDEAVEAYRQQLRTNPEEKWANTDGLGEALIAVGKYAEAIPIEENMDEHERSDVPGSGGYGTQLSVCHWMIGERAQALAIIKERVIAVRDGIITFTDFAGGSSQGVILCYMAATLRSPADVGLAMAYLKKLAKRPYIDGWPGPAALFLLGRMSFGDAVKGATGCTDLVLARKAAEEDLLKRRRLTNILFAAAVERRLAGDESGCHMYMAECANLTTPLIEYEWHLARSEILAR